MFTLAVLCSTLLVLSSALPVAAATDVDVARQTLAPNDGWAAATTGTTGGAAADASHVFVVTTRAQLVAALNNLDPTPKIIKVFGVIDANSDDAGTHLPCSAYQDPGYTLEQYLATYDPAVWGRTTRPSGPLENARLQSQRNQAARIQIRVGPNTTLIGVGDNPQLVGANLFVSNVDNLIIRNLTFSDAFDCFPQWDPTDGALGNWNSQYDNISLRGGTHVWVDHNAFNDGTHPDSAQPLYFGRPWQWHDGECDITNASDFDTVSWNRFVDHDKVMLIGSSDNAPADVGKLRVTVHHNLFEGLGQRTPRVRFGQVHVYNNLYTVDNPDSYVYSWGVGVQSHTFAENNVFNLTGVPTDKIITRFSGTVIHESGNLVNGSVVDIRGAYNARNDPDLADDTSWTPTLVGRTDATSALPGLIDAASGPTLSVGALALDGATGFAEAPDSPDLNVSGDWTVELWFKDEHPQGFNHDYLTLLNKGDRQTSGDAPYTVSIGFKAIQVATRSAFVDSAVRYDLRAGGVDPSQWHHLAATYTAGSRVLAMYLDGTRVTEGQLNPGRANTLPVQIGRSGPSTGKYFHGKVDDLRIWSVARSATDIAAHYQQQLTSPSPGLVANWKLDEPTGPTAADSTATHDAHLSGAATFVTLVHP